MKEARIAIFVIVALMGMLLLTTGSFAYSVEAGDTVYLSDGPGTTGGGEFKVGKSPGEDLFRTFCLEKTEYISYGVGYEVANIVDYAEGGGVGAVDGKDYLDPMTAYLYYNFAMGTLTGYVYGTDASANTLQTVIWYIENEITTTLTGQAAIWYNEALAANWQNIGNVRVMNLELNDIKKQSQLVLVPEPITMLLLGFGLLGLGLMRKKS